MEKDEVNVGLALEWRLADCWGQRSALFGSVLTASCYYVFYRGLAADRLNGNTVSCSTRQLWLCGRATASPKVVVVARCRDEAKGEERNDGLGKVVETPFVCRVGVQYQWCLCLCQRTSRSQA